VALSTWRQASLSVDAGEQRQGLGSSPGIVRGTVRVIDDPKANRLRTGEILVAMRTDPGWAMLFPSAAGILVECGSLLSHAAVVSRELDIPSVVSIPGLTRWLQTGDCVEFDGSTGLVSRVKVASPEVDVKA
jgi:pyruvate,water dikinase